MGPMVVIFSILAGFLILGGIIWFAIGQTGKIVQTAIQPSAPLSPTGVVSTCPDDQDWSGTINVRNSLNDTGSETYDTTMRFYTSPDSGDTTPQSSTTDTTDGAVTLTCGQTYVAKILSTSGAAGDASRILAGQKYTLNSDGTATFTANGARDSITFVSAQHGLPEFRAKDLISDGYMHDDQDQGGSATDYETVDGTLFFGTTNRTCITIDAGGELAWVEEIRANVDDQFINDLGMYVLYDFANTIFDETSLQVTGDSVTLTDAETADLLTTDEAIAYTDYEKIYYYNAEMLTKSNKLDVATSLFALGGQNPTGAHNVSMDYAPIGRYGSTADSTILKVGAVDDSTSRSDVHTRTDTVVCVG